MKTNLFATAFAALFTTSVHAQLRGSEAVDFRVSINVTETNDDPTNAVLFFQASEAPKYYTAQATVDCSERSIGNLSFPYPPPLFQLQ